MLKILNIGPINGGAGDTAPVFGDKVNHMFNELYTREGVDPATKTLPTARPLSTGGTGATTQADAAKNILPAATAGLFLKFDGTNWVAAEDNNTTYAAMSAAEITAGTGTTGRLITPKDLKTAVGTYNSATTTKLAASIKIHGVDFDGSGNIDIPAASSAATGVVKLINNLTTGGVDAAITAEQIKLLYALMSMTGTGNSFRITIPNSSAPSKPTIIQGNYASSANYANTSVTFPAAFPNECKNVITVGTTANGGAIAQVTVNFKTLTGFTCNCFYAVANNPLLLAAQDQVGIFYVAIGN